MIAFLLACSQEVSKSSLPKPNWTWVSTDPHVHSSLGSNDTDGFGTPDEISLAMERAELDFIWLTDHSNAQGSMTCGDVEGCPNLGPEITLGDWPESVFIASEISPRSKDDNLSQPVGHIGCLPWHRDSFSDVTFEDRPFGEITGEDAVTQCLDADGFAILNHPFGPTAWVSYDWSSTDFHAMEVYNGGAGFDASDAEAVSRWESGRRNGEKWIPIGASDCHRWSTEAPGTVLDAPMGWPRTWLALRPGASPIDALTQGLTILGDPTTELNYWAGNENTVTPPGGSLNTPAELFVEARTSEENMVLQIISLHDGILASYAITDAMTHLQISIVDPMEIYVRVWMDEETFGQRGIALGNVIRFTEYR